MLFATQPCDPRRLPVTDPLGFRTNDQRFEPITVAPSKFHVVVRELGLLSSVLPQEVEQVIANGAVDLLTNEDGLLDQRSDEIEHFRRTRILPAHSLGSVKLEPAGKHGQPPPQLLLRR